MEEYTTINLFHYKNTIFRYLLNYHLMEFRALEEDLAKK